MHKRERILSLIDNIIPKLNKVAAGIIDELLIYGNDWDTYDGTGIRDYIHVMDLAEGHIKTSEYLNKNQHCILNLNLGTGKGTSVLELVNTFERVTGKNIKKNFVKRREGDVAIAIAENSRAKNILNWKPKKSIYDMCSDEFKWQKNILKKNKN